MYIYIFCVVVPLELFLWAQLYIKSSIPILWEKTVILEFLDFHYFEFLFFFFSFFFSSNEFTEIISSINYIFLEVSCFSQ